MATTQSLASLRSTILPRAASIHPYKLYCRPFATTNPPPYTLTSLSPLIGASISPLPLDKPLPSPLISSLRAALLSQNILLFHPPPTGPLTPSQFLSFAHQFGQPIEYPFVSGISPEFPQVIEVSKKARDTGMNFGGVWHSDTTYLPEPPMGTLLQALEVPPNGGGDTLFANQYLAYESLSPGLKSVLEGLKCVQSSAKADASATREDRVKDSGKGSEHMEQVHPVVRVHPETGRKGLYVNVAHTVRFEGWSEEESRGLLEFLWRWQVRAEGTCRVRWRPGMIAFWDNRCTLHFPLNDYHGHTRRMHRITLAGDKPV